MSGVFVYPPFPAVPGNEILESGDYAFPVRPDDFGTEVARGMRLGQAFPAQYGRNPDIDPGSTPEDIWFGGGLYTGFNPTLNEEIAIVSSVAADIGTDVSTGTATGGTTLTIEDSGATFIADGVAVGDAVVNESKSAHGIVSIVNSETELTVFRMNNANLNILITNEAGDDYRVVTAASTGAALVRLVNILDEDFVGQPAIYITMNGTTTVTTIGVNAIRCTVGQVILAGASETNEGVITANQAVTIANLYFVMPADFGHSGVMAFTVPTAFQALIKVIQINLSRSGGNQGSATLVLMTRPIGEAWRSTRVFEATTGSPVDSFERGGIVIAERTDVKMNVPDVSDANTIPQATITFILEDLSL